MTPQETVRAVKRAVVSKGGAFMTDQATLDRGRELGYRGWSFYFAGRGGVLGPVDADVVTASFGFFPPAQVRRAWQSALAVATPERSALAYAGCCADWGRSHLPAVTGLESLCWFAERIVDAADVAAAPLFAGWRALPRPEDPPARAAHLLHLLREQRGAAHLAAVVAAGVPPLEAVLSNERGEEIASFFGWERPYPDASAARERRAGIEAATDDWVAASYGVLSEAERKEFSALVVELAKTAT